jgi:hypothetical protein
VEIQTFEVNEVDKLLFDATIAQRAVELAKPSILAAMENGTFRDPVLHVVILDPDVPYSPETPIEEAILYEVTLGYLPREHWKADYTHIARQKARFTWESGLPSRMAEADGIAFLREGDVDFAGSVNLQGFKVASSGVESEYDEYSSYSIAAACRSLTINKRRGRRAEKPKEIFLYTEE